jgi:hypothetical protein
MSWLKVPERNHVGLNMGMIFGFWSRIWQSLFGLAAKKLKVLSKCEGKYNELWGKNKKNKENQKICFPS